MEYCSALSRLFFCKRLPSQWPRAGLLLDHPVGWLFVCLSPCRNWPNSQENGCWMPPSNHINLGKTLLQTRPDQERGMIGPPSPLHSLNWVLSPFTFAKVNDNYEVRSNLLYSICTVSIFSSTTNIQCKWLMTWRYLLGVADMDRSHDVSLDQIKTTLYNWLTHICSYSLRQCKKFRFKSFQLV